jgi:hypothetical protein
MRTLSQGFEAAECRPTRVCRLQGRPAVQAVAASIDRRELRKTYEDRLARAEASRILRAPQRPADQTHPPLTRNSAYVSGNRPSRWAMSGVLAGPIRRPPGVSHCRNPRSQDARDRSRPHLKRHRSMSVASQLHPLTARSTAVRQLLVRRPCHAACTQRSHRLEPRPGSAPRP